MIAVGLPLGVLWWFGIEARDRISSIYREKSLGHFGVLHHYEMQRRNLEGIIAGRFGFEAIGEDRLELVGLQAGERRDLSHLRSKAKTFARIEAYHKAIGFKYVRASYFWFLPVLPDPPEPDFR